MMTEKVERQIADQVSPNGGTQFIGSDKTEGKHPNRAKTKTDDKKLGNKWERVRKRLRAELGEDVFTHWFASLELESFDGKNVHVSVPVPFLKRWIETHYADSLSKCCAAEFKGTEKICVSHRKPGGKAQTNQAAHTEFDPASGQSPDSNIGQAAMDRLSGDVSAQANSGQFSGSPLDKRFTFESYVVGSSNRLAHAAAKQVSETVLDHPIRFNPLYIHSSVGMGKTHLLHAIAWDVKRRHGQAQVLYLTAERFRYQFVEALRSREALAFSDTLRGIDLLLIDDMEFLHGDQTKKEFDHTLNALLDSGKQVVVASANAPSMLNSLDLRMRSRLSGGLVAEISPLDYDLRLKILEQRTNEKRTTDPAFEISRDILEHLAERLKDNGRELEGAVTRLYASCHYTGMPITVESAEHIIKDLVRGAEPKRVKVEDILRVVSRHYGVSRGDLLSQRRHRSVVWPRQIGMYLAKQLTARSLPEIGRRFGGRDHTTVLHAIRKIDKLLDGNVQLKDEIDDLKRLLNN